MPIFSRSSANLSPESVVQLVHSYPRTAGDVSPLDSGSRLGLIFLRGIIWGLIGLVYAPLFTGTLELLRGAGFDHATYVIAAALAGAVGAVLYGAREVALISTGLGVTVGVCVLIFFPGQVSFLQSVLIAAGLAAGVGITVPFPSRCARNVPGKTLAGLASGVLGGAVLAIAEPWHPATFSLFAVLAFLVSVNGVLYVASVRWWVSLARCTRIESQPCYLVESLIMAILAGVAAGSVWMVSGPLLDLGGGLWHQASLAMQYEIPQAILGAVLGGVTAGMLLETFRFRWVHDL